MHIDIEDIKAVIGKHKHFSITEKAPAFDIPLLGDITLEGSAENVGEYILIEGVLSFTAQLHCAACLKEMEYSDRTDFREGYALGRSIIDDDGELDIHSFEGSKICPDAEIEGTISMALPMRLLCKDDCKGLCPHCGIDLNEGSCHCADEYIDPRLAVLKNFKFDDSDKEV